MKYIRTKDGRIITKEKFWFENGGIAKLGTKESDTIEELCDEFVFNVENQGHWVINNYKRALEIAKSYNEDKNKFICYGAIWTDKGLIYVAKMNESGCLELL